MRRSGTLTISEYFGKRFGSTRVQRLAGITTVVACISYMLSAIQGVGVLMNSVTGLSYKLCVILSWLTFAAFTVWSGSSGVLITDTIMFLVFLAAALLGIPFIINGAGGWDSAIASLALSKTCPGIISVGGNLDYLYSTPFGNLLWAFVYGIVWAFVIMFSPWQTSRYLMARNEKTVMKSAVLSSIAVISITTILYFAAAFVQSINPDIVPSECIIWAAMNLMPRVIGVVLLTGILAAGISSASTFMSLIGFSLTNDILKLKGRGSLDSERRHVNVNRLGMLVCSVIVLILAYFNPPQIFWIMYFGGTVIASAWAVTAIASVWSRRISELGAFLSMLLGLTACAAVKVLGMVLDNLPAWLDPFFIGILCSLIGAAAGSCLKKPNERERAELSVLHKFPEDVGEARKYGFIYIGFACLFTLFLVFKYALIYKRAVG